MPLASELTFQTLSNGETVPCLDGKLFCSSRDPSKEAASWLQHQVTLPSSAEGGSICLLGLGYGRHLDLLLKQTQLSKIQVIERHQVLIELWKTNNPEASGRVDFSNEIHDSTPFVLEFRPAWSGQDQFYHELSQKLRQATAFHLKQAAEHQGLWNLSEVLKSNLQSKFELTVKDITTLFPIENQTEEARVWRTLREFVK